jgi:UDP-glucuronate 4-epimerase
MIKTFEELLGKEAVIDQKPFNSSDMMHTWANIDKAGKVIDWQPEIDFEEGMKKTVEWYLENREWLKNISV